jgi:aspartate beta-hydroxylase
MTNSAQETAMSQSEHPNPVVAQIEQAQQAVQAGQPRLAEELYRSVLQLRPDHVESLAFVGTRLLRRGALAEALPLLERANGLQPDAPAIQESLGIALLRSGRIEEARHILEAALAKAPGLHLARLRLGKALALLGNPDAAAIEYFRALTTAQKHGVWMSVETTPPALLDDVRAAVEATRERRSSIVEQALDPIRQRHGAAALERVDACIKAYLGDHSVTPPDARQRPRKLYFPDLPATPYLPASTLPWLDTLRTHTAAIQDELSALRQGGRAAFQPFLNFTHATQVGRHLRSHGNAPPAWDAFFFYRHGVRDEANHALCPQTSAALETCPLNRVRGQAPEICFSVLTPGTHILPHHGDTNTRVVVHLPLIVPPDCALNVAGELCEWREGEPVVFDDTFLHEAWNRSDADRVVLILDAWNPHLTAVEREALTAVVPDLGDFDRACQMPTPA